MHCQGWVLAVTGCNTAAKAKADILYTRRMHGGMMISGLLHRQQPASGQCRQSTSH